MAFLKDEDYKIVVSDKELDVIIQSDADNRRRAEEAAQKEISSYLRNRYDMGKAFAARDEERDAYLVLITVNVSLYYMVHWLPHHMASEARHELYQEARAWLKDVAGGKASADLPGYTDEDGNPAGDGSPVRYGTMKPNRYDY